MCFDPYNPLGYEDIEKYFDQEWEYMPDGGYCSNRLNKRMRQEALDVIIETIREGGKVDPFVPYLAMSYFDCYLSRNGLMRKKYKMMEDTELLAICCLSLAYKTTLSVDMNTLDLNLFRKSKSLEEKVHQFLIKRPKNVKYLQGREAHDAEKVIENGLEGRKKSITALCFIRYFLNECKPRHEALEERESITRIILETQADIRFCSYKPSIISASAVTVFLSDQAPENSQTYEEKIMRLRCLDKNCLALVKETCDKNAKRKLEADYGLRTLMKKMSPQGEEKGFHCTIDYELQWMTAAEIEDLHDKYFDPYDPCGFEDIDDYLKKEREFMADGGYSENPNNKRLRQVAMHLISDTIRKSEKVDAFVPYLALTYLDCYISRRGLLEYKETIMEDMELLVVSGLSLAFETTLSKDFWGESKSSEKIRRVLMQRRKNMKYLFSSSDSFGDGCLISCIFETPEKPVTALCFINYFLNECKPHGCDVPKGKESITQIILETHADIRFCAFKPSIISASAVIAFICYQAPEYAQICQDKIMHLTCIDKDELKNCLALVKETCAKKKIGADTEALTYEEKIMRRVGYIDKNQLKNCLALMKENYDKKNLRADIGMKKLSLQGGENGFHVSIDYKLQWIIADEIEEILQTLGAGTRLSIQLANINGEMMRQTEEIQILVSEMQNAGNGDDTIERLSGMLEKLGKLSLRMEEVIIKMTNYVETPQ